MKYFHLISWNELKNRKIERKNEIVFVEDINHAIARMKDMNAQKRLSTTDYTSVNLTMLCETKGITLTSDTKSEEISEDDE